MDALYFLKKRTRFIRYFYETASEPFRETIRKIEAGEAPYDDPDYGEGDEPPFMEEWSQAGMGQEILGRSCISMLSASLQLYLKAMASELGIIWQLGERRHKDWFDQYRTYLAAALKLSWDDCPASLDILEQIILARNRDQHPDHIADLRVRHDHKTREKYAELFFVSDTEKKLFDELDIANISWMSPTVHVSREALIIAVEQVETFGDWIEERMHPAAPMNVVPFPR